MRYSLTRVIDGHCFFSGTVVLAGNFNAKSVLWGSIINDRTGEMLNDMTNVLICSLRTLAELLHNAEPERSTVIDIIFHRVISIYFDAA